MEGWIKLNRKLISHWIWENDRYFKAWIYCLFRANFTDNKVLIGSELNELKVGEFITSINHFARDTGLSEQGVRTFWKLLENDQMINKQSTSKSTKITVCNYKHYQYRQQTNNAQTNKQTTNKQQTNNNSKEYKELIIMFNNITGRNFKGAEKSKKQFNARLKEGFSLDDFRLAITNCFNDEYHRNNPKYLTPEFITRSEKLQQYMNIKVKSNKSKW